MGGQFEEEKHPCIDPDLLDKLNHLAIDPKGLEMMQPTKWNENPQQV